ncbi:SIR2 family protein [Acetobacter malorum]|uniref:SIR2 family protein n=1 Tax=Acetobacter malorum TaxID=178901 RepID=UPI0018D479AD|nr:SIR2 family protein [Acetobacter malorum]
MTKSKAKLKFKKSAKMEIKPEVELFVKIVNRLTYKNGPNALSTPLCNLTFWVGAGFSKAWNSRYPTSAELFRIRGRQVDKIAEPGALSRTFGVDMFEGLNFDRVRALVYQLDMQARYPDVRSRYVDEQNIKAIRSALASAVVARFVEITGMQPFDREAAKFILRDPTREQREIIAFFNDLEHRDNGSQAIVEGLRTHFISTNYDNVIETILDNVIGEDDSTFIYGYRGVTPIEIEGTRPAKLMHDHWLVRQLIKINGGFEILRKKDGFVFNYENRTPSEIASNPPVVMLPSREQDYTDSYFQAVFPKAVRLLRETSILVIVGYSLPDDDALMRFILRQFAEEPEDGRKKFLFYVDPSGAEEKFARLETVFPLREGKYPTVVPFNSTFNDFVRQYLHVQKKMTESRGA